MANITRCERTLSPEAIWEDLPADAASRQRQKKVQQVQQSEANLLAVLHVLAVLLVIFVHQFHIAKTLGLALGPVLTQAADLATFLEAVESVEVGCMLLM